MTNKTLEEQIEEIGQLSKLPLPDHIKYYRDDWSVKRTIPIDKALNIINQLQEKNKSLKDGLSKIANHFEDHSTIHSQAKTLKRMARTYLNKINNDK